MFKIKINNSFNKILKQNNNKINLTIVMTFFQFKIKMLITFKKTAYNIIQIMKNLISNLVF